MHHQQLPRRDGYPHSVFSPNQISFRTNVHSKRWIPLCHSLSIICIDDRSLYPINTVNWVHFGRFMDAIMFNPHSQRQLTLKSFWLEFFYKWVEASKRRHLYLSLVDVHSIWHLRTTTISYWNTLLVLRLMNIHVVAMFHCSVELPFLKTLRLCDIYFEVEEDFTKLLSRCPELEY